MNVKKVVVSVNDFNFFIKSLEDHKTGLENRVWQLNKLIAEFKVKCKVRD